MDDYGVRLAVAAFDPTITAARPKITIRYAEMIGQWNHVHYRSYRWLCHTCDVGGINRFDRFTDRVHANQPHPWVRCVHAVDRHYWDRHRSLARLSEEPQT